MQYGKSMNFSHFLFTFKVIDNKTKYNDFIIFINFEHVQNFYESHFVMNQTLNGKVLLDREKMEFSKLLSFCNY